MRWRWFAIGFVAVAACQLDTTPRDASEFDVKSSVILEPRSEDLFASRSGGRAGNAGDASHATGTRFGLSVTAGQPAMASPQAGAPAARPAMMVAGSAAGQPATAVAEVFETAGAGGAAGESASHAEPASSPQQGPAGHDAPDAGILIATAGTRSPGDAAVPDAAQDAAMPSDAARAAQLSQDLLFGVLQLLIHVRVGANLTQDVANLVPLLIAGGVLNPPLLTAALSAIDDAGTCNDRASIASCAAICGGLAMQCKQCAADAACLSALQRVCRGQIRVESCK